MTRWRGFITKVVHRKNLMMGRERASTMIYEDENKVDKSGGRRYGNECHFKTRNQACNWEGKNDHEWMMIVNKFLSTTRVHTVVVNFEYLRGLVRCFDSGSLSLFLGETLGEDSTVVREKVMMLPNRPVGGSRGDTYSYSTFCSFWRSILRRLRERRWRRRWTRRGVTSRWILGLKRY